MPENLDPMPHPRRPRILVVRNDKLGDFMLAWPALALLKQRLPEAHVVALIPEYTRAMAELCPSIDAILPDPGRDASLRANLSLIAALRRQRFDAVITLFSTGRVGAAVWLAGIPYRLAPATKLAQIFYNQRVVQRRSRSIKPEWQYNTDLVRRYLADHNRAATDVAPPYLHFTPDETARLKHEFCRTYNLDPRLRLVFVHPGSGGSARNLSLEQFASLAIRLRSSHGHAVVVTCAPAERAAAEQVHAHLAAAGAPSALYVSSEGLPAYARRLAFADLFISGSTGPLHIAAALNRATAAFYPRSRVNSALRWQTVNDAERRLSFSPPETAGADDMATIDIDAAAAAISRRFLTAAAADDAAKGRHI